MYTVALGSCQYHRLLLATKWSSYWPADWCCPLETVGLRREETAACYLFMPTVCVTLVSFSLRGKLSLHMMIIHLFCFVCHHQLVHKTVTVLSVVTLLLQCTDSQLVFINWDLANSLINCACVALLLFTSSSVCIIFIVSIWLWLVQDSICSNFLSKVAILSNAASSLCPHYVKMSPMLSTFFFNIWN